MKAIRLVVAIISILVGTAEYSYLLANNPSRIEKLADGVWKIRFGVPEKFTPVQMNLAKPDIIGLRQIPKSGPLPFDMNAIAAEIRQSQTIVYIPCDEPNEQIYGFGLDPQAYEQKGLTKYLTISSGVIGKTGAGHGPVPFYISTRGYGIYVDTARVPYVHVASLSPKQSAVNSGSVENRLKTSEDDLYARQQARGKLQVIFDIASNSTGVDVYVLGGPSMREVVQRYNLFSGGGCIPPMSGLGLKYRTYTQADSNTVLNVASALRDMQIPCDVIGLEPGWQSHAYSCSLTWSNERFPCHQKTLDKLISNGFRVNLWEHAYIHPTSPLFDTLKNKSGDYLVWGGLVVDFADPAASRVFADYHENYLVNNGISSFKLDECDRQPVWDCTPFNYPYCSKFPSGIDGYQMTQLYGYLYQGSLYSIFKKKNMRTWGDVRATSAMAASLPFNLYSDAYSFDEYLRQLVNASFTGLLWSPEVRDASSYDELMNRIALASFAPQMCFNIWYMPHPIWEQYDRDKNQRHELLSEKEQSQVAQRVRELVNMRMQLLPYLYSCFAKYHFEGLPPVRSLILEFPSDVKLRSIDNEFMFGDNLLIAPFMGVNCSRKVYLPQGSDWVDFRTNRKYKGWARI